MSEPSLSQMRRMQFMAVNYSRLQGLRGLPPGLGLFAVTLWANRLHGPAGWSILLPLLFAATMVVLYWLTDRYYKRAFGRVVQAPRGHLDWIIAMGGGVLGLIAFIIDITFNHLPFSIIGLVLAAALLFDYLKLVKITQVWYMPFWSVFSLLITLLSILPVLGLDHWWLAIGTKSQLLGVVMGSGLIMIAASITSHVYFAHTLSKEALYGGHI